MLLANTLQIIKEDVGKVDVAKLFSSNMKGREATFGIQNVSEVGLKEFNVFPGQWYGINQMSIIMETLNSKYTPIDNFKIITFQDGNVNFGKIWKAGI